MRLKKNIITKKVNVIDILRNKSHLEMVIGIVIPKC